MKTIVLFLTGMLCCYANHAQTNFNVALPAGQEVRNLSGNICCFYRNNIATDASGTYVLSDIPADSSIWVTKYDLNGNLVFNTRVGVLNYETNYHYSAKKIKVYDRVYVLCRTYGPIGNNPNYHETESVYTLDKSTGAVDAMAANFIPYFGDTDCQLVDLIQTGGRIWMVGQTRGAGGPGSTKVHVMRSDLTWNGNSYLLGSAPSTDYYLNAESTCITEYNGGLYVTGEASSGPGSKIFIARLDVWGFISEYIYTNSGYIVGGKGLNIATEGNSVYVAGALRAQATKPLKTTVLKIDTTLSTLAWININKNSEWPLGFGLTSTDVIYTVDYLLRVVGFSKSTGNQLFAKSDFKNYAQVYNQPISAVVLNNNQLFLQASVGVKVMGNATINKVTAKYSTSGMKVYQQLETLSNISPGNPGSAEALGLSYSPASNYLNEVYRLTSSAGQFFYVKGRTNPVSLRVAADEEMNAAISVFPNPATEQFTIRSENTIESWTLYDMTMRLVASGEQAGNETVIDCKDLESAMYILHVYTSDGEIIVRKLMVQ